MDIQLDFLIDAYKTFRIISKIDLRSEKDEFTYNTITPYFVDCIKDILLYFNLKNNLDYSEYEDEDGNYDIYKLYTNLKLNYVRTPLAKDFKKAIDIVCWEKREEYDDVKTCLYDILNELESNIKDKNAKKEISEIMESINLDFITKSEIKVLYKKDVFTIFSFLKEISEIENFMISSFFETMPNLLTDNNNEIYLTESYSVGRVRGRRKVCLRYEDLNNHERFILNVYSSLIEDDFEFNKDYFIKMYKDLFSMVNKYEFSYRDKDLEVVFPNKNIQFVSYKEIINCLDDLFNSKEINNIELLNEEEYLNFLADFISSLYKIYPFKEVYKTYLLIYLIKSLKFKSFEINYDYLIKESKYFYQSLDRSLLDDTKLELKNFIKNIPSFDAKTTLVFRS